MLQAKRNIFGDILSSPLFIIIAVICIANWQLVLGIKSMQWDVMNFWMPWRHFIAECYTNGIVPLWDPYTQAGYPVHGDLQGPAYNPETIISSFLFPVSVYFLNFIFLAYLVLGAYGLYKFTHYFQKILAKNDPPLFQNNYGALIAGCIYAISGYVVWQGHYLYITISVGLIPWLYYYVIKIVEEPKYIDGLKFCIFTLFQITAGNPSFLIVSGYFFVGIVLAVYLRNAVQKNWKKIFASLKVFAVSGVVLIAMALPVIVNAYYVMPETTRGNGISLEWAAEERFQPASLFTFFSSLTAFERDFHWGLDQPISDYFIGSITLFFAAIAFIRNRTFWMYVLVAIAIIAFMLSLGLLTPVFGWFHHFLPFFNVFRMPRLIFIYVVMVLLVMAGVGINNFLSKPPKFTWFTVYCLSAIFISGVAILYYKFGYKEGAEHTTDSSALRYYLWSASQPRKAFISFLILAFVIALSWLLLKRNKIKALFFLLLIDAMLNYNLGAIARNYTETEAKYTQSYINYTPKNFPLPANIESCFEGSFVAHFNEHWQNTGIYVKQMAPQNYNSFEMTNYAHLYNDDPLAHDYFLKQPAVYLADSLVQKIDSSTVLFSDLVLADSVALSNFHVDRRSVGDTVIFKKFEPQFTVFKTHTTGNSALLIKQNLTDLWHFYLDDVEVRPAHGFYAFPLIAIPTGDHVLECKYILPHFRLYLLIALTIFSLVLIFILFRMNWKGAAMGYLLVLCFCSFKYYSGLKHKDDEPLKEILQEQIEENSDSYYVLNCADEYREQANKKYNCYNFLYNEDVAGFTAKLPEIKNKKIVIVNYKAFFPQELKDILKVFYGAEIRELDTPMGSIMHFEKKPQPEYLLKTIENEDLKKNAFVCKAGSDFSPAVVTDLQSIGAGKYDLVFIEADLETNIDRFQGLCLNVERNGESRKWLGYSFLHYRYPERRHLCVYYRLPENTQSIDKISAFLWNGAETPVLLKNLRLSVISRKAF